MNRHEMNQSRFTISPLRIHQHRKGRRTQNVIEATDTTVLREQQPSAAFFEEVASLVLDDFDLFDLVRSSTTTTNSARSTRSASPKCRISRAKMTPTTVCPFSGLSPGRNSPSSSTESQKRPSSLRDGRRRGRKISR